MFCEYIFVARHVITERSSPQEATALLQESSLLHLEDVFPLFPDFVTIDEFRVCFNQEICYQTSQDRFLC